MSRTADRPEEPTTAAAERFRHLPDRTPLEDTVASIPGDLPAEAGGERNPFIAAALNAGG